MEEKLAKESKRFASEKYPCPRRKISDGTRGTVMCKSQQYPGENPTSILVNKSFQIACMPGYLL
jgi:hypothetical protein